MPDEIEICSECGYGLATADGHCLDCPPANDPADFFDESEGEDVDA